MWRGVARDGRSFDSAGRDGAARFSLLNIPQPVAQADEDWNGRITALEWDHAATRRFALLDKQATGRLTRESLVTANRQRLGILFGRKSPAQETSMSDFEDRHQARPIRAGGTASCP